MCTMLCILVNLIHLRILSNFKDYRENLILSILFLALMSPHCTHLPNILLLTFNSMHNLLKLTLTLRGRLESRVRSGSNFSLFLVFFPTYTMDGIASCYFLADPHNLDKVCLNSLNLAWASKSFPLWGFPLTQDWRIHCTTQFHSSVERNFVTDFEYL